MRQIDPQHRFGEDRSGPDSPWHDLSFSSTQEGLSAAFPRIEPVRLNYCYDESAPVLLSDVAAVALVPHTGQPMVTYRLLVEALSENAISAVSEVLVASDTTSTQLEMLRKLYEITGPDCWTTSAAFAAPQVSPEAFVHHNDTSSLSIQGSFNPELPSLGEYLKNPEKLGRKYSTEVVVKGDALRLEALVQPQDNMVRFDLFRSDPEDEVTWRPINSWNVKGNLVRTATEGEIEDDLRSIARKALSHFETRGYPELPKLKTSATTSQVMPLESDHVILSTGASVNLVVSEDQAVIAIGSRPLDPQTLHNPNATVCKWTFRTPSDQVKRSLYPELSRVMLVLSQEHSPAAVHNALQRLLTMGADREEVIPAPLSTVLHPSLTAHLKSMPEIRLTNGGRSFYGVDDFAQVLRGVHRLQLTLRNRPAIRGYPQLFNRMGVLIKPDGSLELLLKNRMHNAIKATFSARTVRPTATTLGKDPSSHLLSIASSAFAKQIGNHTTSSQARRELLETLTNFQRRDPQCNSVKELGLGKMPGASDVRGHALIDRIAAPLIRHYINTSKDRYTDSHAQTTGNGEVVVTIGDRFHPYQLFISSMDDIVSGITVTPRFRTPEGKIFLKHEKAQHYACDLQVGDAESAQASLAILKDVVKEFWALVDFKAPPSKDGLKKFRSSGLRRLLNHAEGPFKRL